jgi:molybdenum-dependent DNA-binding transcriptional regulator ModE
MTKTPEEARWALVFEYRRTGSAHAAAKAAKVSWRVAKHWVDTFEATGRVNDRPRSGRKPIVSAGAAHDALKMLLSQDYAGCKEVAQECCTQGLTSSLVHSTTILRAAKKAAKTEGRLIKNQRGQPRKQLTQPTRLKRLAFARAHKGMSFLNVMFTDRKRFMFAHPGSPNQQCTWLEGDATREATTVNHPQSLNVYAGLTCFGITSLHLVSGTSGMKTPFKTKKGAPASNITQDEYKHVVELLLADGARLFSANGVSTWVFQQDNDPAHKQAKELISAWNNKKGSSIQLISGWPPNSPDLSPIENLWGWMTAQLDKRRCGTFAEFKKAVQEVAKAVPAKLAKNLVSSMKRRLESCIDLQGKKTKY